MATFLGAAGVLAGHPLDTVKARLQTQKPGTYRGPLHCFTSIVKKDNVRGLYKGKLLTASFLWLLGESAVAFET